MEEVYTSYLSSLDYFKGKLEELSSNPTTDRLIEIEKMYNDLKNNIPTGNSQLYDQLVKYLNSISTYLYILKSNLTALHDFNGYSVSNIISLIEKAKEFIVKYVKLSSNYIAAVDDFYEDIEYANYLTNLLNFDKVIDELSEEPSEEDLQAFLKVYETLKKSIPKTNSERRGFILEKHAFVEMYTDAFSNMSIYQYTWGSNAFRNISLGYIKNTIESIRSTFIK